MRDVLNISCLAAQCLEREKAAVLITENTGTDLSLVISSLAQILLKPDTRTLHGLQETELDLTLLAKYFSVYKIF